MTDPAAVTMDDALTLRFRLATTGDQEQVVITEMGDAKSLAGGFLTDRPLRLGETELRQHSPATGDRRPEGYLRLDNEIFAGRQLRQVAQGSEYPVEVACLYGDEATSAEPFALFEPDPGQSVREAGEYLTRGAFDQFAISLLTALYWLAGAGIAHRAISPDTVLWDDRAGQARITDLSRSAPFGSVRTPVAGVRAWVPRESRPETCYGLVGPGDDTWAAIRLLYFVRSRGGTLDDMSKLAESGLTAMFSGLLEKVFGPPEGRPTARDLVEHGLRKHHVLPSLEDGGKRLIQARAGFLNARARWRPDAPVPEDFWDDIAWARGQRGVVSPRGGAG